MLSSISKKRATSFSFIDFFASPLGGYRAILNERQGQLNK